MFEKKTYVTEHYVISHKDIPYITLIEDISKLEYMPSKGSFVYATLKGGKKVPMAKVADKKSADKLAMIVKDRNRDIEL